MAKKNTRKRHVSKSIIDLSDPELFGNDAGEDEKPEILASYFVNQLSFDRFLDRQASFSIARARKGMGKSALLKKLEYDLKRTHQRVLVVHATPVTLAAIAEPPSIDDHVLLENYWKQAICALINVEIGRSIGFALSDTEISMVEASELAGFKGKNIVGSLVARLSGKLGPIEIEAQGTPKAIPALQRFMEDHGQAVWLLLDDIDSRFVNTPLNHTRVATFFSACRSLINEVSDLYIRATVRTDVWANLTHAEDLDKCEQYVADIRWTANQQDTILTKKIIAYVQRKFPQSHEAKTWTIEKNASEIVSLAFLKRMSWGDHSVPPYHPIRILSAGRPRWMSQLCRLAGNQAKANGESHIGIQQINQVMGIYGRSRLDDLYKEHNHQYGDLKGLVEAFSGGPRRYTTEQLLDKILHDYSGRVGVRNLPLIDGYPYKELYQLAHFLFKCGFIAGHNSQKPTLAVPEFVTFEQRPELLTTRINPDDGMMWEIQPSYRQVLRIH